MIEFITTNINQLIDVMTNMSLIKVYIFTKTLFIFLNIIILMCIIFVFPKAWKYKTSLSFKYFKGPDGKTRESPKSMAKIEWQKIINKAYISPPHSFTLAIIEADSFVDKTLKKLNIEGETMADRLKMLGSEEIKTLNTVWEAHKIRNNLVHEPGKDLSEEDAKRYLYYYESFLKEIGVL